jgi:hypothetical protein
MNNAQSGRWALLLSFPLAVLLAVACIGGLFFPSTYANETRLNAAQDAGSDAGNLVLTLPLLIVTAVLALRGSLAARLVWMGTLVDLTYNFLYYALGVHFNSTFLVYCAVLGLSSYALAGSLPSLPIPEIACRFGPRTPVKTTAIVLLFMTAGTVVHWLSEIVPALLAGRLPPAVRDSGLLTETVAVLDLAFMVPASIIAAILLLRRKPLGFVLGPILLTFLALGSLVLASVGVVMALRGYETGRPLVAIALGIAVGSAVLLVLSLREAKPALQ